MDAATIVREVEAITGDTITVRIHSNGGLVAEGLAMYNALAQSEKKVDVYIDGVVASMASVVAMAGDNIYTPDNALWMIHKPWGDVAGNANVLRQAAENLDVLEQSMLAAYTGKGRVSAEVIQAIFDSGKDHYMTGAEAAEQGFADTLTEPVKAAASTDLSNLTAPGEKNHKALFEFYAVNAAQSKPSEAKTMLKKLRKMKAALLNKGVAMADILSALAEAFGVSAEEVEALLGDNGSPTDEQLTDGIAALAKLETPAPQSQPQGGALDAQAVANDAVALERTRIADISALATAHNLPDEQRDRLISEGTKIEEARAQVLEFLATQDHSSQPRVGYRFVDVSGEAFREGMANALMNRMQPGRFKLEEGGTDFRGMNMIAMASECLERVGVSTRGLTANELAAKAMHTTSDFPEVVADVANKVLLAAYQAQPRTFLPIATEATLSDFKQKHAIEIGGGSELEEVNESGEFEHGTVSEGKRSYKLSTFGRIFSFTRQLLINDDIGALNQFISNVGGLASRKESTVVWGLVKTGAIYSSANKNLVASGGAVNETQLSNNRKLLRKMKGLDGEPINVTARHLVVNSERETEAQKQIAAILAAASGDVNVFSNSLNLIVEPLLDDVTNNPWYTFADPMLVPTLEYAYLEGESGPYIETQNGFEVDGIKIKVRHDFGAGWVSHRGSVKNPGA